ncbi:hypothetical protein [Nocardia sp. NBC_00511]|uniref:hypothetical protein n=1 Tax=Nocardia sp. NBC_00511 TaxID=2903591 RepID=UPI0030E56322
MAAALGIALAVTISASGCSTDNTGEKPQVDSSLSELSARDRITAYLLETVENLPPGASLSFTPDAPDLGTLGARGPVTVPCQDGNLQTGGPQQVQVGYWVVGIPAGQDSHYFELIRNIWTQRGFQLQSDGTAEWAPVTTPDGYGLNVKYLPEKANSVSISAGSPCIAKSNLASAATQPSEIKRPG